LVRSACDAREEAFDLHAQLAGLLFPIQIVTI
jgi:hypothetical protein